MSDLIDRDDAISALVTIDTTRYCVPCKEVLKAIRELPSVEPYSIKVNQGQSSDLISRQALLDDITAKVNQFGGRYTVAELNMWGLFCRMITQSPSAEPQIIRCKDCKHRGTRNCVTSVWSTLFKSEVADDFYCGIAERMEVEHE